MSTLHNTANRAGCHPFDLVLDAIEKEVPADVRQFVNGHQVMEYIRHNPEIPDFVLRHCAKVNAEMRQLALA